MKFSIFFFVLMVNLFFGAISCKNTTTKNDRQQKNAIMDEEDPADILKYKVKQQLFEENSPKINFENVYLNRIKKHNYKLNINVDNSSVAANYHENYYVILSIYPFDDEIGLLKKERQKYGFEMFSAQIRKNPSGALTISRMINTKINFARAITLSVVEYKSKKKSMEIVMQNVKF